MATYQVVGNTKISSSSSIVYRTLTIPAIEHCTYTLTITKGDYGELPSYEATSSAEQALKLPFGTTCEVSYTPDEHWEVAPTSNTYTMGVSDIAADSPTVTPVYYTLTVGATTDETYAISGTADETYGGTIPTVTGESEEKTFQFPYGSTAVVTYTGKAPEGMYIYVASETVTKLMTSDQTVDAASAEEQLGYFTMNITQGDNTTLTVMNGEEAVSDGDQILYGTELVVTCSTADSTAQYTYSDLSLTVDGTEISSGDSFTVTGEATIVSSCTATVNQYTLTISQGSNTSLSVKLGSSSGDSAVSGNKYDYGTVFYISGSANTGYGSLSVSPVNNTTTTMTGNLTVSSSASLLYYTLSVGASTNQTYTVTGSVNSTYGGSLATATARSAAWSGSEPYGATMYVTYTASSATAQYTYTASSKQTKTMTSAQSVGAASATATVRSYTVSIGSHSNATVYLIASGYTKTTNAAMTVKYGTVVTATATPSTGYSVSSVSFS